MKRNRFFAWVLAAALSLSLTAVPASAAYPDVDPKIWDWAVEPIEDMTQRGLFQGYKNGNFGPADELTLEQALILAARICADLPLRQEIGADRREEIKGLLGDVKSWWWDEAATCLEAEILSYDELRSLCQSGKLDQPITMEDFSVYIVRAMQLGPMAKRLTNYPLSFADAAKVTASRQPYVYLLDIYCLAKGDEHKNFNPQSNVNRARAATLISRVLDFMELNDISAEFSEYTDYQWTAGTIANVTTGDKGVILLSLETEGADMEVVSCLPDIKIYQGNMKTDATSLKTGVYARVNYDEKGEPSSIRLSGGLETVSGGISSITENRVIVNAAGTVRSYDISRFTRVQVGGSTGDRTLIDVEAGYTSAVCKTDDLGDLVYLQLSGGTRVETGLISGVEPVPAGGYRLTVTDFKGMSQQFVVPATAVITANSVTANVINTSYTGSYVSLRVSNQSGEAVSVVIDTVTRYKQGAVKGTSSPGSTNTITIGDPGTSTSSTYNVSADAVITFNDEKVFFKEIQRDWFVTVRISGGEVVLLTAYSGFEITSGTVSKSLEFRDGVVTLSVLKDNGAVEVFQMEVDKLPTVKRDGANSTIDKIKSGDTVTVTKHYNQVTQIDTVPQSANVRGTIQDVRKNASGTTVELLLANGVTESYLIGADVTVTQEGQRTELSKLDYGVRISMVVNGGEVYSIEIESAGSSATKLTGVAQFVNVTDKTILFETKDNLLVTVSVPANTKIVDAATGTEIYLRNLNKNGLDSLVIYGKYEGAGFKATSIIRES